MAELSDKGKHAKRHKPSRLRNEIRPDSTDDERDTQKHAVQVPGSDAVVPETQMDDNGRFDAGDFGQAPVNEPYVSEVALSPKSAAVLERNTAKKNAEPPGFTPIAFKLFSKETLGLDDNSRAPSFSFRQANKASFSTMSRKDVPATQSTACKGSTAPIREQRRTQTLNDSSTIAASATYSPPASSGQLQHSVSDGANAQHADKPPQSSHVPDLMLREPVANHGSILSESASDAPPSEQPDTRPADRTRKMRTIKKGKKGRKGASTQQRDGPWPPRSADGSHTMGHVAQAAAVDNTVSETFADPRDLSQIEPQHDQTHCLGRDDAGDRAVHHTYPEAVHNQAIHAPQNTEPGSIDEHNMGAHSVDHGLPEDAQDPAAYVPPNLDGENVQCNIPHFDTAQDMPSTMPQHLPGDPAQNVSLATPIEHDPTNFEQPAIVEPEQQPFRSVLDRPATDYREDASHGQHAMPSHQGMNSDSPRRTNASTQNVPICMDQRLPLEGEMTSGRPSLQRKQAEAVLHGTSSRDVLHRVSKLREKPRATSASLAHRFQGPSMSENVERSLGNLRMALLADNFRMQHEHTISTKQQAEVTAALNTVIDTQKGTIAGYKQQNEKLDGALSRLLEKAKTNQKYITGLQKDHEKLQKSFTSFQSQSKQVLQAKITEFEKEKDTLCRDFDVTIDKVGKSQRGLLATIEDLYTRLVISDSKKKDLAENLSKQQKMCEEERRKRDDLEKQLLASVQSIQRQLGDSSTAFSSSFELLQSSVDAIAADDTQKARIKECLAALQSLQTTPFLTTKDLQKAEGMLRFVHERVESELGVLTKAMESKAPSNEELQTFIKQQLHNFQLEVFKYEELVAENRKTNESNDMLKKQVEAQQQYSAGLEQQIKSFHQTEVDLKARASQLERDLDDLKDATQYLQTGPSELEQGMLNLRGQLEKADSDLKAADGKVKKIQQEKQGLEQEAAKYKKQYETAKDGLLTFDAESKAMHEKITNNCQKELERKESDLNNEIQRLEHALHEGEQKVEELHGQLDVTKNQFDALRKDAKTLESDLDAVRKEQTLTEARLETAQLDSSSQLLEIAKLKKLLRQDTEELEAKTRDYNEAQRQRADLSNQLTEMEGSRDRLQAQVSQQFLTMKTMRQETDSRLSKVREEAQSTLQPVRDELSNLQQEKQNLLSQLEQVSSNETRLNNAQAAFTTERTGLQQRVVELRTELDVRDATIFRMRADEAEKNRKLIETHQSVIDDCNRRLLQSDAALKEVEAKHRLAEDQFQAKLAADHKLAETKLLDAEQRYLEALQAERHQSSPEQRPASHESAVNENSPGLSQNIHGGKARKKVNRNNHSVLSVGRIPIEQGSYPGNRSQVFQIQVPATQYNDLTLFEEQAEAEAMFVEPGFYLLGPEAEIVPETQEVGSLNMSPEVFLERLTQASQKEKKRQNGSSTDLSSVESDDLRQMQMELPPMSLRGHDHGSSKLGSSQKHAQKMPVDSDSVSVAGSRSSQSQDRPRSQANTASRMMPPPKNAGKHSQSHVQAVGSAAKASTPQAVNEQRNQKLSSGTSTPDYMHHTMTTSKHTYSQRDPRTPTRAGSQQSTPRVMEQSHLEKRKSATDQNERDGGAKKQRGLSQSYPIALSGSQNGSPYASRAPVADSRSKKQVGSSYMQGVSSSTSREKTRGSSSSVQPRTSSQILSSSDAYSSRRQQASSSQNKGTESTRRVSSRVTRSTSRNETGFDARFDVELGPRSRL